MSTTNLSTFESFLQLPEPKQGHYELHRGVVVFMPPPKWGHARMQKRMEKILERFLSGKGIVRTEMSFRPAPEHEFWVADVGFVRAERDKNTADDEYLQGAPDLVVEVLSPSNTATELNDKLTTCVENGCASFWVVDQRTRRFRLPRTVLRNGTDRPQRLRAVF